MFLSSVTSMLLNEAGAVFWPREKWHSLAAHTLYGAVAFSGPLWWP